MSERDPRVDPRPGECWRDLMPEIDLARLSELHAAATPGEWIFRAGPPPHIVRIYHDDQGRRCTAFIAFFTSTTLPNVANADFVAGAHNTVPALLAELERLRRVADIARQATEADSMMDLRVTMSALRAALEAK